MITAAVRSAMPLLGEVRLQKTFYFLHRLALPGVEELEFSFGSYGPHSFELGELLNCLIASAVIEERGDLEDEWQNRQYVLGPRGETYDSDLPKELLRNIVHIVQSASNEDWRVVELAATIDWLAVTYTSDRAAAVSQALEFNPAYSKFSESALNLLNVILSLEDQAGSATVKVEESADTVTRSNSPRKRANHTIARDLRALD